MLVESLVSDQEPQEDGCITLDTTGKMFGKEYSLMDMNAQM